MRADYAARHGWVCVQQTRKVGWGSEGSILGGVPEQTEAVGSMRWVPVGAVYDDGIDRPRWSGRCGGMWEGSAYVGDSYRVEILHPDRTDLPPHPSAEGYRTILINGGGE